MKVLILAASEDHAMADDGYPVCLADVDGRPLLQRLVEMVEALHPEQIIFVFRRADIDRFHLDQVAKQLNPKAVAIAVEQPTAGAACSALLASTFIDNDDELLVLSANSLIEDGLVDAVLAFRQRRLDAGIVTFESVHPRYSYVKLDGQGLVVEAAEKSPISRHATSGTYWYAQGRHLVHAVKEMIRKHASVDGIFYISPSFNEMVLRHQTIGVHAIEADRYRQIAASPRSPA